MADPRGDLESATDTLCSQLRRLAGAAVRHGPEAIATMTEAFGRLIEDPFHGTRRSLSVEVLWAAGAGTEWSLEIILIGSVFVRATVGYPDNYSKAEWDMLLNGAVSDMCGLQSDGTTVTISPSQAFPSDVHLILSMPLAVLGPPLRKAIESAETAGKRFGPLPGHLPGHSPDPY